MDAKDMVRGQPKTVLSNDCSGMKKTFEGNWALNDISFQNIR